MHQNQLFDMQFPIWYAIILGISFVIFYILLFVCLFSKKLYPGFSIYRDTISEVQDTSMKTSKYINGAFAQFGILMLFFPPYVYQLLPNHFLSFSGCILLYCCPVGLIILSIWPNFTNSMHYIGAGVAMGGSLLSMIFLIYPLITSPFFNVILVIVISISLLVCIPLVYSNVNYGSRANLMHNPNFWEWFEFFMIQIWVLFLYLNLIFVNK